ncbi:helix-turn-helix domain-containing protein [Nostoc sp. UHCC 0252]|uniref:helix-turn-helix domain-containing protein n=1 Tax=Nostoc sp. UHCC 0252 TaxID=3110241 RepID=UPI002B218452|nr:helix-turn-helix domain-containing protein [Nostoc sp. UHCC 0252]MEA5603690.1 helix-turn-helix domain-containing protein [Nostoc sp. UHCC 0252]
MIATDLITTKEAAKVLGLSGSDGVRYYIRTGRLKGYKNRRGYMYVSLAEVQSLTKPEFTEVEIDEYPVDLEWERQVMEWVNIAMENSTYD